MTPVVSVKAWRNEGRLSTWDQRTPTIQPHTAPEFIASMLEPGTNQCGRSGMLVGWTGRLHGAWPQNTLGAR
jgi:hypothetical protein